MKKFFVLSILFLSTVSLYSRPIQLHALDANHQIQDDTTSAYIIKKNSLSNVDFYTTNYGMFGLNILQNKAGVFWPRASQNSYIYGGGVWFGAQKRRPDSSDIYRKYTSLSYNPKNGNSCFVPGLIEDGDSVIKGLRYKNQLYSSVDFNRNNGTPKNVNSNVNWPLWINSSDPTIAYGTRIYDYVNYTQNRNFVQYPQGPLFVSDEDMVAIYKDTYLPSYEIGETNARKLGYPLRTQIEQRIFSWGTEELQDVIVLFYTIENKSNDTLKQCWFAPMIDSDLSYFGFSTKDSIYKQADNDRIRYYNEDPSLNLAVQWTETNRGELGKGFGYIGYSFLESPAIDVDGFIRNDKAIFEPQEQIGLTTFRNWDIESDKKTDQECYDFMSESGTNGYYRDGDTDPGDKRLMMATGPFNMRPGDKARIAISLTFAMPAKGGEADGTTEDIQGLNSGKVAQVQANEKSLVDKTLKLKAAYYKSTVLSVDDNKTTTLSLNDVYPNPTYKAISLDYYLDKESNVNISLFDQFGTEIQSLFKGLQNSGKHSEQFQLNTQILSSGIYYIKIQSRNESKTKTISIIK